MNEKDIVNFRNQIKDFSVDELKEKRNNLQNDLSKMILNSELIIQIAIIESLLEEKEGK